MKIPKERHPLLRRLNWHPLVVVIPWIYLTSSCFVTGFGQWKAVGVGVVTLWFLMSLYDFFSKHKFLDWVYSEDDEK